MTPRRAHDVRAAEADLRQFCRVHRLPLDRDTVQLYLTNFHDNDHVSGRGLRTRLALLDAAAKVAGKAPWSRDPDIRRLLNGLHRSKPLEGSMRALPLYLEHVHALIDATTSVTHDQARDVAVLLIAHDTHLPARALADLRWQDIRFTRSTAIINAPPFTRRGPRRETTILLRRRDGPTCPVQALLTLRRLHGIHAGAAFGSTTGPSDQDKIGAALRHLPGGPHQRNAHTCPCHDSLLMGIATLAQLSPQQLRDRAMLTIGYAAALRGREAIDLRTRHVRVHAAGLTLDVPRRRRATYLTTTGDAYCPWVAWQAWRDCVANQSVSSDRAFTQISGTVIWPRELGPSGLNYLIHQRCEQAQLLGAYTFTSLRIGYIRTALRADVPPTTIAAHADFASLTSVARHERRENILRHNVAAQLGL